MAQQITIDIVAETKKLTSGIDDANKQITGMSKGLKTATAAAAGLASAFVLKAGVSFLKDGIDEAKDARTAMLAATSAFGKGSDALKEITAEATKFGKELGMDNDDVIKLATSIGVKLPASTKGASTELVLLAKNLEATSGGSIAAEATLSKLGKAFADGELSAKELSKAVPGLDAATLKMVETLSKAGKNQEALNLLIEAGEKKYGGAAASQVTATQKFDVALADLKETIGTKVLPILEKLINIATDMIEAFGKQPKILQNVELALLAIVAVGGPLLGFFASAKTAMVTLGLVSEGAAIGTNLLSVALKAIPILAVIALVILLITHWEDVQKAAKATWEAVSEWFGKIYNSIKEFIGKAIDWVKENWPLLLGVLTGPFGLFAIWIVTHLEDIKKKISDGWNNVKDALKNILDSIGLIINIAWLNIGIFVADVVDKIKTGVVDKFNDLKDATLEKFRAIQKGASEIWGLIRDFITNAVNNIKDKFGEIYGKMVEVGQDIARGIWAGLSSMTNWFSLLLKGWINQNIPYAVRKILGIASPSKVMAQIGQYAVEGLYKGMGVVGPVGIQMPQLNIGAGGVGGMNITINAGLGTDPYELGRTVTEALTRYGKLTV
jgi:hypothetical protein